MNRVFIGMGVLAILLLAGCSENESASRSGVDETTNAVALLRSDGSPFPEALVFVRPQEYVPVESISEAEADAAYRNAVTDEKGRIVLETPTAPQYTIEVRGNENGALSVVSDSLFPDTIWVESYALVEGHVDLPAAAVYARIVIPGMDRLNYTDSQGNFSLEKMPAGDLDIVALLPDSDAVIAQKEITVTAGDTLNVDLDPVEVTLDDFSCETQILLDTRESGAPLQNTVYHFPLLVYLENETFPEGAASGGADIRVTDPQGNEIPFGIAWWDDEQEKAQLWILLDSVKAGDSSLVAELRYGSPLALSHADMGSVFDSASSWLGAWDLLDLFRDGNDQWVTSDFSSGNHPGVVHPQSGFLPDFSVKGATFSSDAQYVAIPNPGLDWGQSDYTLELWVVPSDTCGVFLSGDKWMMSMKNQDYPTLTNWDDSLNVIHSLESATLLSLDTWEHLAFVHESAGDSAKESWFVQGALDTSGTAVSVQETPDSIYIAAPLLGSRGFRGTISRVHLSSTVRSPDWVALSKWTQQRPSPAVIIVPQE